ncbi:unnamed protein product [Lota lota]
MAVTLTYDLPMTSQHVETYYVEAGSKSFTLPLPTVYKADPEDILTWKRNTIVVTKVSQSGALELPAEDLKVAGQVYVYTLEVFNKDGQLKFNMKSTLHLLEKLGTPSLSFNCQDEVVVFNCNVSQSKDLVYAWTVNNVTQSKKTPTLEVQWEDIGKSVRCTVSNKAGKKDSQEVIAVCGGSMKKFLQDYFWFIVGGAGGLALLLLFITVTCCVQAKRRRKKCLQTESELRLEWTNQTPKQEQPQKQQPQQKKKKKRTQQSGPQPHRCKPSGDPHRHRHKDTTSTTLASNDATAGSANPARPRPSPRPPQHERDSLVGMDHGPPLPNPRKKVPKTHTRLRDYSAVRQSPCCARTPRSNPPWHVLRGHQHHINSTD